ncbi:MULTISPECIES: hypothetical protein [Liquorilactobacillus]|uniref:hypothetical protein n=1 Tax=Liquorilactobacillus TaxID=2767888 RepID=UPI001CBD2934|nr:hypothetical protein [Liquorilactobacillus hordei]MBZ2406647.1 hypothetical protein [Liquorilactobacillus hordei]
MAINEAAIAKLEKARNEQEANGHSLNQSVIKLLDYKGLTDDENAYIVFKDDTYGEMLQLEGVGLASLSGREVTNVLSQYLSFLLRYLDDTTYITALYPVETDTQRGYWIRKYRKTKNPIRQRYIEDKIKMLEETHKQKTNQEYTLLVYGENIQKLEENIMKVRTWGGTAIKTHKITREKKTDKIFQLNNMNIGSKED